jgi:serine/threonine-protein kinase
MRRLAQGGMAELYLAVQRSMAGFEKMVVIKRILQANHHDGSFVEMLLSEARVAATLSHPNIVQTFDVGEVEGTYFIAMEHVHGEDIRGLVRQMRKVGRDEFPLSLAVEICAGIAAGLAYAHSKRDIDGSALNIVHRDISPQNVVVTFDGDVKIVDFGIAKSDVQMSDATESGKLKGKIPYMSPEQARGETVDGRSDIFSLGIILFELTTGRRLFKGASEYETMRMICEEPYPRPSSIVAGYPRALEAIVLRALAPDRHQRYQNARELQEDLQAFAREERLDASSVALSRFMRDLFRDELAKEVADREAVLQMRKSSMNWGVSPFFRPPSDAPPDGNATAETKAAGADTPRPPSVSTPAAALTVRDATPLTSSATPRAWWMVGVGLGLTLVIGGGLAGAHFARKAKPAAVDAPKTAILRVASEPAGATIWINGEMRPEVTPATIEGLPRNVEVEVRVTKDGYEPARQRVVLDMNQNGLEVQLEAGHMVVELLGRTPNAEVELDGKPVQGTRIEGLASGTHELVVREPGHDELRQKITGGAYDVVRVDVELKKSKPGSSSAQPLGSQPAPGPSAAPSATAPHGSVTASPNGSAPPPASSGKPGGVGKLNVGAAGGWCNVAIDGVARGPTPVAGVELPAGAHRVTCTTEDGKVQNASVVVKADDTARYRFNL